MITQAIMMWSGVIRYDLGANDFCGGEEAAGEFERALFGFPAIKRLPARTINLPVAIFSDDADDDMHGLSFQRLTKMFAHIATAAMKTASVTSARRSEASRCITTPIPSPCG
jgi:hypothetical protein